MLNPKSILAVTISAVAFVAVTQLFVVAQDNNQRGQQHGPPPEAFSACSGSSEGDSCSMNTPRGTAQGTCQSKRNKMVCVPEGHDDNERMGPPPERD